MQDDHPADLRAAERIVAMLDVRNIPTVVIGAVALAAHRYIRFTEDIDLGVLASLGEMRSSGRMSMG